MTKIQREKQFHNKIFSKNTRSKTNKYYTITNCSKKFYIDSINKYSQASRALEYGCGPGSSAFILGQNASSVTGIDISDHAIDLAKEVVQKDNVNVSFQVMNAENLLFSDNSFELVCGSGIIHHLDLQKALSELARVLTPNGKAFFLEPLGHNPLINFYRNRTPSLRTVDEHPLLLSDLEYFQKHFQTVQLTFFHFTSLTLVPFRNTSYFSKLLNLFDRLDAFLFTTFPFLQKYAWTVVLTLHNPIK